MANKYTNDLHEFWQDRAWPDDDRYRGFTFLARAMLDIGHALFRDYWTGGEPYLSLNPRPLPLPLPSPMSLPTIPGPLRLSPNSVRPRALAADAKAEPDDGPWWNNGSLAPKIIERNPEADRILLEARGRWGDVMEATTFFLNRGRLESAWRGLYGGAFTALADTDWNSEIEIIRRRFQLCRITPSREQAFTGPPDGPAFIYIKTDSLQSLLAALNTAHPSQRADDATAIDAEPVEPTAPALSGHEAFRLALIAKMRDDPHREKPENWHLTKDGVRRWAKEEFGLGWDDTDAERKVIMHSSLGFEHTWNKPGPPKKNRREIIGGK